MLIVRSAAFLNLKAGAIEEAQKMIFWGLLNIDDQQIKDQLNQALEYSIALKNSDSNSSSDNFEYLRLLRQRSVYYTIESTQPKFGTAVTFETIRDFADDYLKSLKAYAVSAFKQFALGMKGLTTDLDAAAQQFEESVNPLITDSAFGSFKFSIANDFLGRHGENSELVKLKATVLLHFHDRIFTNPLDDTEIESLKKQFQDDEIDQIFRPITRIKAVTSPYKVAYFDKESFNKIYLGRIATTQKKKLLPPKQISQIDIGWLESSIVHARSSEGGKKTRNIIQREQLKSYEFDIKTNHIEAKDRSPLLLSEEIIINVIFNSDKGFTFSFDDLSIEHTDIDYNKGLTTLYTKLFEKLVAVINTDPKSANSSDIKTVARLINNTQSLKK